MQILTVKSKSEQEYTIEYDETLPATITTIEQLSSITSSTTGKTLKCVCVKSKNDKRIKYNKNDIDTDLIVTMFDENDKPIGRKAYKIISIKNIKNFQKTIDIVNNIQYNTDIDEEQVNQVNQVPTINTSNQQTILQIPTQYWVEQEKHMATSFFKSAVASINNNPFKDMSKIKATDLLTNHQQVTVTYFDKYVGTDGKASYRCKIAEDERVYFYAVTDLKRLLTTALSQGATVEQLNEELPLKFNITPTVTEYEGKQYNSIQFDLVEDIPVVTQ